MQVIGPGRGARRYAASTVALNLPWKLHGDYPGVKSLPPTKWKVAGRKTFAQTALQIPHPPEETKNGLHVQLHRGSAFPGLVCGSKHMWLRANPRGWYREEPGSDSKFISKETKVAGYLTPYEIISVPHARIKYILASQGASDAPSSGLGHL